MSKRRTKRKNTETVRQARAAKEELPPKKRLTVPQRLNSMVTGLLGGPRGDPDSHHPRAIDKQTIQDLRTGLGEIDYIDLAERDVAL